MGALLLLLINISCKETNDTIPALSKQDLINVKYADHSQNNMDIYLPASRNSLTPVILFIHGGFWSGGDKAMLTELAEYMRDQGYASVNMNYRLTNTAENNIHPAQVNDIKKVFDFLEANSSNYKISSSAYAIVGASSGAHLSLLYSYQNNANNKIKTVVSMAGPTNFSDFRNSNLLQSRVLEGFLGTSFNANPNLYIQASPVTHVSGSSAPTLIFHGKLDAIVPFQQSAELKTRLDQFNVSNKLIVYDDLGHEFAGIDKTPDFLNEINSWISLYLK